MAKYIITWNSGYGETDAEIEADSVEEARNYAYEEALEEFNSNASYSAELADED